MEANEIKEAMAFFAIIFNRGDGFWARRWKFFELINNRGDTIIRSHRVVVKLFQVIIGQASMTSIFQVSHMFYLSGLIFVLT